MPRFKRRKEARPDEITDAAFEAFAEHGYAGARVDDVARRAGVSKGLLYLYFKTKEELFKAVITRVISPRVTALAQRLETSNLGAGELLRGPVRQFMKELPETRARVVLKLMISEGSRHPDLVDFYWREVASKGLGLLQMIIERGIESGEFRDLPVRNYPQLVVAPMVVAVVWKIVFARRTLDTDGMIDAHIDMLVASLRGDAS